MTVNTETPLHMPAPKWHRVWAGLGCTRALPTTIIHPSESCRLVTACVCVGREVTLGFAQNHTRGKTEFGSIRRRGRDGTGLSLCGVEWGTEGAARPVGRSMPVHGLEAECARGWGGGRREVSPGERFCVVSRRQRSMETKVVLFGLSVPQIRHHSNAGQSPSQTSKYLGFTAAVAGKDL